VQLSTALAVSTTSAECCNWYLTTTENKHCMLNWTQ